jgi:hypothetical protein
MSTLDPTKPQIYIERARKSHVLHLVLGEGRGVDVILRQTLENAAVIDYFYEKLKDGQNL